MPEDGIRESNPLYDAVQRAKADPTSTYNNPDADAADFSTDAGGGGGNSDGSSGGGRDRPLSRERIGGSSVGATATPGATTTQTDQGGGQDTSEPSGGDGIRPSNPLYDAVQSAKNDPSSTYNQPRQGDFATDQARETFEAPAREAVEQEAVEALNAAEVRSQNPGMFEAGMGMQTVAGVGAGATGAPSAADLAEDMPISGGGFDEGDVTTTVEYGDGGPAVSAEVTEAGIDEFQQRQRDRTQDRLADRLNNQTEADLDRGEDFTIERSGDQFEAELTDSGRRAQAAAQTDQFTQDDLLIDSQGDIFASRQARREAVADRRVGVSPDDVTFQDRRTDSGEVRTEVNIDGVQNPGDIPAPPSDIDTPNRSTQFDETAGTGAFGVSGISPSARMGLDSPEAIQARAEKEQDILDQREVDSVGDVPGAAAATLFGFGQDVEKAGVQTGEAFSDAIPSAEIGPEVGQETIGEAPSNLVGGGIQFAGMGIGAAFQAPASVADDIDTQTSGEQTPLEIEGGNTDVAVNVGESQVEAAAQYPFSTTAGFALPGSRVGRSFERGLGDAGVTTPRRPTVQRVSLGDARGATFGLTRQRGRVTETQPLFTAARGTEGRSPFETGTPEVSLDTATGDSGVINPEMSAAEADILANTFRRAGRPDEATKIESFRNVQAETQFSGLEPDSAEPVVGDVLESQGIPREGAGELTDLLASEDAQLYGSIVQRASAQRIGEPGVSRTPRDIDVGGLESSDLFARRAERRLNEAAGEDVVTREGDSVRSAETGEELFDLHEIGEMDGDGSTSIFGRETNRFGVAEDPTVRTTEGVETTTLPEQTRRKGMGATEVITEEPADVGPITDANIRPVYEGRVKDIPDFFVGERANIEALRRRGDTESAARAQSELESFVDAFGDEIGQRSRSEFEAARAGEREAPVEQIADFADDGGATDLFGPRGRGSDGRCRRRWQLAIAVAVYRAAVRRRVRLRTDRGRKPRVA